jgi:hypothetical protein
MSTPVFNLDVIDIASPCHVPWESMPGTERVRFCSQCRQSVYNLLDLDRAEAETLVRAHEGRLCVRFYRRPDGRMITRDCGAVRWARAFRRRVAVVLGGLLTLYLLVASWVDALTRPSDPNASSARRSGIRDIEPFKTVLNWIDPTPPVVMGRPCFITPRPSTTGDPEVAPPPRPVEQPSGSER